MRKLLLFLVLLLQLRISYAQDSQEIEKILNEAKSNWNSNSQLSIELTEKAIKIAKSENNRLLEGRAYQYLGNAYWYQNNYNEAIENYNLAVNIQQKLPNKLELARTYNRLGIVYKNLSSFDKSLQNHEMALKIRREEKDDILIATSLNNIGSTYLKMNDFRNALDYYLHALKLRKKNGAQVSDSYRNVALVYSKLNDTVNALDFYQKALKLADTNERKSYLHTLLGNLYLQQEQYDVAIIHYKNALNLRKKGKSEIDISSSYQNLGIVYKRIKKYDLALKYHSLALDIRTKFDDKKLEALSLTQIAEVYFANHEYEKALKNYTFAHKIYTKLNDTDGNLKSYLGKAKCYNKQKNYKQARHNVEYLIEDAKISESYLFLKIGYQLLAEIESNSKHFEQAFIAQAEFIKYQKLLNKINNEKIISEMKTKFLSEEKTKENILLRSEAKYNDLQIKNQKHMQNFLISILIVISLFVFFLIYQNLQKRKTNIVLNTKNELIKKQKSKLMNTLKNLSEKQDAIMELEKQNSVMAMVITANHEINQPLMTMKGNVELLQMTIKPDYLNEKHKKYFGRINSSIDEIATLLEKYKEIKEFSFEKYVSNEDMLKYK